MPHQRDLKAVLSARGVDYSQVIDKEELLALVASTTTRRTFPTCTAVGTTFIGRSHTGVRRPHCGWWRLSRTTIRPVYKVVALSDMASRRPSFFLVSSELDPVLLAALLGDDLTRRAPDAMLGLGLFRRIAADLPSRRHGTSRGAHRIIGMHVERTRPVESLIETYGGDEGRGRADTASCAAPTVT